MREYWATHSVKDHLAARAFVATVIVSAVRQSETFST